MRVTVRLFAGARELAGQHEIALQLSSGADVAAVRTQLAAAVPRLAPLAARSLIAVNSEYAQDQTPVREGDEVALIPPVSGG